MKTKLQSVLTAAVFGALGIVSEAITITPASGILNTTLWQGNERGQSKIDSALDQIIAGISLQTLYRQNVGRDPGWELHRRVQRDAIRSERCRHHL
jgi:hypothetical protein